MSPVIQGLSEDDFFLAVKISGKNRVLAEHNAGKLCQAASLIKVFYALEVLRRIEAGLIKDEMVKIEPDMVNLYGTNVLGDVAAGVNDVKLSVKTLVGLMIKYSCNSSTSVLIKHFLPSFSEMEKISRDVWGLEDLTFEDSQGEEKKLSLNDMCKLYTAVYGPQPALKDTNGFLMEKLKTSRNIYYLFDQLEVKVLGSKSGTLIKDGFYWIGDTGVIEVAGQKYFLGAISKRKHISEAVLQVRKMGRNFVNSLT